MKTHHGSFLFRQCLLMAQGCCCSPDNLRLRSIQRSLMHHRLQCPDNGLCFPVSYGPTEVGSPGDSWFCCRLGKVLFFSWKVCCKGIFETKLFYPPMKNSDVLPGRYGLVSSNPRPEQEVFTMQIAKLYQCRNSFSCPFGYLKLHRTTGFLLQHRSSA